MAGSLPCTGGGSPEPVPDHRAGFRRAIAGADRGYRGAGHARGAQPGSAWGGATTERHVAPSGPAHLRHRIARGNSTRPDAALLRGRDRPPPERPPGRPTTGHAGRGLRPDRPDDARSMHGDAGPVRFGCRDDQRTGVGVLPDRPGSRHPPPYHPPQTRPIRDPLRRRMLLVGQRTQCLPSLEGVSHDTG